MVFILADQLQDFEWSHLSMQDNILDYLSWYFLTVLFEEFKII
jgi:hypothetical protein